MADVLLSADAKAAWLYQLQLVFHGSTAPGFLFASGFVAGESLMAAGVAMFQTISGMISGSSSK